MPTNRRLILTLVLMATLGPVLHFSLQGQQQTLLMPIWNGLRYIYPRLGPSFTFSQNGSQIDCAAAPVKQRFRNVVLTFDQNQQGWPLPDPAATDVTVYVLGLRYDPSVDYTIVAGVIKPATPLDGTGNFLPTHRVTCDYSK